MQGLIAGLSAGLYGLLPACIFVAAALLAFSTGTSYGTFGVMIPIVASVFPADSPLLVVGISACLAGAVCGDHCSPIFDTTVMAATGAEADLMEHVTTQLPYAATVAAVSFVTYIVAGFWQNWMACMGVGALLLASMLMGIRRIGI